MSSDNVQETKPAPRPVGRIIRAAVAVLCLAWLAWWASRAGLSRLVSDYGVRARVRDAVDLAVRLTPPDPEAHYARANLLADAGDYAGAIASYREAIRLRPRDYVLWQEIGKVKERAGDAEGALDAFREAARLAPFYAQPRWLLGNTLLRAGRLDEALAEMRRAAESDPRLYGNLIQAVWHSTGKEPRTLVEAVRPRTPEESIALAKFLIRNGATAEAMRVYRESGRELSEDERRSVVKDLINAGSFDEAYEVWAAGRARGGGGRGAVTDGGFEETLRTHEEGFGWQFARGTEAVKASLDASEPREGARSLRIDLAGDSAPSTRLVSQLVVVEPGAGYRLEFSVRVRDVVTGGPLVATVVEVKGAQDEAQLATTPPLPVGTTDGWRDFSIEFAAPQNVRAVRLVLRRQECSDSPCPVFGSVWLDRFALKKL